MPLTDVGENFILTQLMTGAWISLHLGVADPSNEVVGGNYNRIAYGPFTIVAGDPSQASNTNLIEFPIASADWGFIVSFGVNPLAAAGNLNLYGILPSPREVLNGDTARFPPGTLIITAR